MDAWWVQFYLDRTESAWPTVQQIADVIYGPVLAQSDSALGDMNRQKAEEVLNLFVMFKPEASPPQRRRTTKRRARHVR